MNVLHILTSPIGGANIGALEYIKACKNNHAPVKNFVVYHGHLGQQKSPYVCEISNGCAVVPMRFWHQFTDLNYLQRVFSYLRMQQLSHVGLLTQRYLERLVKQWGIQIIHTNNAAILEGALLARRLGLPHVWHVRELIGQKGWLKYHMPDKALIRTISALSEVIVPMSQYVSQIFHRYGQSHKVQIVYDGVDVDSFALHKSKKRAQALRATWGIPDHALVVGQLASACIPAKLHALFIRAAYLIHQKHKDVYFVNVGTLPDFKQGFYDHKHAYFESLRTLVKSLGLEKRFLFAPHYADIPAIMHSLDIVTHSLDIEGFGRTAIEAMAAKKPVVMPRGGGFLESVQNNESGFLFNPHDENDMALKIKILIDDKKLRKKFSDVSFLQVNQRFSLHLHMAQMNQLFSSLLS